MFKLIVMLFVITNGVVEDHPSEQLTNKRTFTTEKVCLDFLSTDAGKEAALFIDEMINEKKGKLSAKYFCVKEDDSI